MLNLNIMLSNFLATLSHKSYFFSKQLKPKLKMELLIKTKLYLKINIYLNQASTLRFRPVLPLYRNQSTDIWIKLMGWFLYNDNNGLKHANPNLHLSHILFFPFTNKLTFPKCST